MHSDWEGLDEITTYIFETKEPIVDWSQPIDLLDKMEDVEIQMVDGVYAV